MSHARMKGMARKDGLIGREDLAALAQFRRALRRFLHFTEKTAREFGLTPQQHQALLAVRRDPNRDWASLTEIADAMQIRHNAIVGLVDRCEALGLLMRSRDPEDGRVVRVSLTELGESKLIGITNRNIHELKALGALTRDLEALNVES